MSSILEALREIEGSRAPEAQAADEWDDRPRTGRAIAITLAAVAVLGAIAAALFFALRTGITPPTAPSATPPAALASALPPAAPAPPPPAELFDADPPRAQVAAPTVPAPAPAAGTPARPRPRANDVTAGLPRQAGEPRISISAIAYATRTQNRTVTLSIDGGAPVTLREGESAGTLDVQLIEPDSVYLRHGGQIFAVQARD